MFRALGHGGVAESSAPMAFARGPTNGYNATNSIGPSEKISMDKSCTLMIHRTESGYRLAVQGRGTLRQSPAVRDFVCGAMDDSLDVVVDLSECEYLDSTFLGCLVILQRRGKDSKASFSISANETKRQELLAPLHLDRFFSFAEAPPESQGQSVPLRITHLERAEFGRHLQETHDMLAKLGGPAARIFRSIAKRLSGELGDKRAD